MAKRVQWWCIRGKECERGKERYKRKGEGRKRNTSNTPPHQRENPRIPVRSPSKPTNNLFFIKFFDLPCKRTCHGNGRLTKLSTTTSSPNIHSTIYTEYFPSKTLIAFFKSECQELHAGTARMNRCTGLISFSRSALC